MGRKFYYKKKNLLDKLLVISPKRCELWHTTFQLAHYVPCNGKVLLTVHDLNFLYEKAGNKQKNILRSCKSWWIGPTALSLYRNLPRMI